MLTITDNERLAILLNVMGENATSVALQSMDRSRADVIRRLVDEFRSDPPSREEVEFVVQDFERYFKFALAQLTQAPALEGTSANGEGGASGGPGGSKQGSKGKSAATETVLFPEITATGDPIHDLTQLDPYQIAMAIQEDQPKTIALILAQLEPEFAARVLEYIPEDSRIKAFLHLGQPVTVPHPIIVRVLHSAFDNANRIRERRPTPNLLDQLAEMVRALPKDVRRSMVTQLKEQAPELSEQLQSKLYRFEDIMRLNDRSVQAVMSKVQSDQLVMALTRADKELVAKLLGNVSKRVRESIEEEISFNERAAEEEIQLARDQIALTLGKMDEAGEISL